MDPNATNPTAPADVPAGGQTGVTTPGTAVPPVVTPVPEPTQTPVTPEPVGGEQPAAPAEPGTTGEETPPTGQPAA